MIRSHSHVEEVSLVALNLLAVVLSCVETPERKNNRETASFDVRVSTSSTSSSLRSPSPSVLSPSHCFKKTQQPHCFRKTQGLGREAIRMSSRGDTESFVSPCASSGDVRSHLLLLSTSPPSRRSFLRSRRSEASLSALPSLPKFNAAGEPHAAERLCGDPDAESAPPSSPPVLTTTMARPRSPTPPSPAASLSSTTASPSSSPTLPDRRASADLPDNVCLGMDEDLENKLEGRRSGEQLEKGEAGQGSPHHHPATLEPDDWRQERP